MQESTTTTVFTRSFGKWTLNELKKHFNIKQVERLECLERWLEAEIILTEEVELRLERLRKLLLRKGELWNEQELIMQFIAPLLDLINFNDNDEQYAPFANRLLTSTVADITLTGNVDWMLASGEDEPIAPYFCLHEYKRNLESTGEPKAQILSELFAAYHNNANNECLRGVYVIGTDWRFITLQNNIYATSEIFEATKQVDLYKIYALLAHLKTAGCSPLY